MKAMILAAGRGERMRPLTDTLPKPLLKVNNKPLIVYHIEKLKAIGITEIVINHAWLGKLIEESLGDGTQFGVRIEYSQEGPGGLETAGGIANALHLLTDEFIVVNGDVYSELDYKKILDINLGDDFGCLFLVKNPKHNQQGDFGITNGRLICTPLYTFSGISIYKKEAFLNIPIEKLKLKPYFEQWIAQNKLQGVLMSDFWCDVGTAERLAMVDTRLRNTLLK